MLQGSIVALVTPFDKNRRVAEKTFTSLIDWQIEQKTDALLICGTTGESATLSHKEHKDIIDMAVSHVNKCIPVIAGCGSNSTTEALDLTQHAQNSGADYALVITPYYNRPTQEGLYQHFKTIADSVSMPIIIYNVPTRTGSNILPQTVVRLYNECKNIVGIKEASGSLGQMTQIMSLVDEDFLLFSGSDELTLPILSIGGKGVISVVANIVPKQMHELVAAFLSGNYKEAQRLQLYLYELIKGIFIETNPIPIKTALAKMKLIELYMRLPLCPLSDSSEKKLFQTLGKYGIC